MYIRAMNTIPMRAYADNHDWIIQQARKKGWSVADEVEALVHMAQSAKYQRDYNRATEKTREIKLKVLQK